jgi:pyroglutamyl-peptidase
MVAPSDNIARHRATVLLTGFEPFGNDTVNPSWLAARELDGSLIAGHLVVAAQLPTVFDAAALALREQLLRHRPALALGAGQAGGRAAICLERVAINVNDARIPDNTGAQPVDTPVVPGAPAAYFTTLPIKAMLSALLDAGIAAQVSQTAGTFVCNHVFYALMHELATDARLRGTRGGFVHVPWLPEQGEPSMPLQTIVQALRIAIQCALATQHDIRRQAGSLN